MELELQQPAHELDDETQIVCIVQEHVAVAVLS